MGKIKLSLLSGAIVEKPLVSAFKANNNSYVILDNEINGSMGLPIILVSKLIENKLVKIVDQNEWQIVKEYLKNIIAGNKLEYIKIGNELFADDIYYTQLTLPVPSFDTLKRAYSESGVDSTGANNTLNVPPVAPIPPVQPTPPVPPVENVAPVQPTMQTSPIPEPTVDINMMNPTPNGIEINNASAINPLPSAPINNVDNNINPFTQNGVVTPVEPTINQDLNNMVMPEAPVNVENPSVTLDSPISAGVDANVPIMPPQPEQVMPIEPNIESTVSEAPIIESNSVMDTDNQTNTNIDINNNINVFQEQKEAFMQACENMFDALVQKFEKELQNRK